MRAVMFPGAPRDASSGAVYGSGGGGGSSMPREIRDAISANVEFANAAADTPFQAYTGQRVAEFNPDQQSALGLFRNATGAGSGAINQAVSMVGGMGATPTPIAGQWDSLGQDQRNQVARMFGYQGEAAGGQFAQYLDADPAKRAAFNQQLSAGQFSGMPSPTAAPISVRSLADTDLSPYLNPYTQNVIDTTLADLGRQNDIVQNKTLARMAGAGAFGSQGTLAETENDRNYLDTVARTTAGLNQANFGQAQNAAVGDISREYAAATGNRDAAFANANLGLSSASLLGNLGLQQQQQALGGAQALLGAGSLGHTVDQAKLDAEYQEFMRQIGYPADQVQLRQIPLNGALPQNQPGADRTGQLLGAGTSLGAAALLAFCFSPDTPVEMADGSTKPISEIEVGDETKGGRVYAVTTGDGSGEDWFDYLGVKVTGSHGVHEDGRWIRVRESAIAAPIEAVPVLHSFSCTGHEIHANGVRFTDHDEVDRTGVLHAFVFAKTLDTLNREAA